MLGKVSDGDLGTGLGLLKVRKRVSFDLGLVRLAGWFESEDCDGWKPPLLVAGEVDLRTGCRAPAAQTTQTTQTAPTAQTFNRSSYGEPEALGGLAERHNSHEMSEDELKPWLDSFREDR